MQVGKDRLDYSESARVYLVAAVISSIVRTERTRCRDPGMAAINLRTTTVLSGLLSGLRAIAAV